MPGGKPKVDPNRKKIEETRSERGQNKAASGANVSGSSEAIDFNVVLEQALAKLLTSINETMATNNEEMRQRADKNIEDLKRTVDKSNEDLKRSVDKAIEKIQKSVEDQTETVKGLVGKVDRNQADIRGPKRDVVSNSAEVGMLKAKLAYMEDQSRRNNIRITGLAAGREGNDAVAFLRKALPEWIPEWSHFRWNGPTESEAPETTAEPP